MKSCFTLLLLLLATTFGMAQTVLLDFEGDSIKTTDFNGSVTTIIANPDASGENTTANVASNFVPAGAAFAGSIRPVAVDLANGTQFTLQVWSPVAGAPVLLKLEGDGGSTERAVTASGPAMAWQTLTFDFGAETGAYPNVTMFMNFNVIGGEDLTFFYDNLLQMEGTGGGGGGNGRQVDLPVTFDEDDVDYSLVDFEGATSMLVEDPTDADNTVVSTTKNAGAATFAGTTISAPGPPQTGFASRIELTEANSVMTVRVWSPTAGTPVRLKIEDFNDPTVSVETQVNTTVAMQWETLSFDFKNQADGTAPVNYAAFYNKATIFFDFGTSPTEAATYFWDDVEFDGGDGGGGNENTVDLPITFDDADLNYALIDFAGAASMIVDDPEMAGNNVVQVTKTAGALLFAGTVIATQDAPTQALASPIAFSEDANVITMRVWSPTVGTPVRVKVENAADGSLSVEAQVNTEVAMAWDTLVFDFRNEIEGNAINYDNVYDKIVVFFDFGSTPMTAAEEATYFYDDIVFTGTNDGGGDGGGGGGGGNDDLVTLPVDFNNPATNFDFADFGGAMTTVVVDPTDASNTVAQTIKQAGAMTFAGTVLGATNGLGSAIGFNENQNTLSVRVWSPTAGTPVRVKVENAANGEISVETEVLTTVAMQWETLEFDMRNNATERVLDYDAVYNKFVIFFDFGSEPTEAATYYWDDVILLDATSTTTPVTGVLEAFPNPVNDRLTITAPERMESVTVYSAAGQLVGQWVPNAERMNLDMTEYAPGMYVALVVANGKPLTVKFLKK